MNYSMKINENSKIVSLKCELVPYEPCHVEKYHQWMEDEEIRRLTGSERLSLDEEYEMQRSWRQDEDKLTFIILEWDSGVEKKSEEDRMIGDVNLFIGEEEAEVEIMIAENRARGKGIGQAAVSLIISYAINNLSIQKFCVKITDDNLPSLSLFEKLGFTRRSHSTVFKEHTLELPDSKFDHFERYFRDNARIMDYR